jgi:hypothetical protein
MYWVREKIVLRNQCKDKTLSFLSVFDITPTDSTGTVVKLFAGVSTIWSISMMNLSDKQLVVRRCPSGTPLTSSRSNYVALLSQFLALLRLPSYISFDFSNEITWFLITKFSLQNSKSIANLRKTESRLRCVNIYSIPLRNSNIVFAQLVYIATFKLTNVLIFFP